MRRFSYVEAISVAGFAVAVFGCTDVRGPVELQPTSSTLASTVIASGYAITDLGTLGGLRSFARGINDAGVIVGESLTADGHVRGFVWDGVMHPLGTLGGSSSRGWLINGRGDIIGGAETASGELRPVLWRKSNTGYEIEDLGSLGGGDGFAYGLNERGDVVGISLPPTGDYHAFLWTPEEGMRDLGTFGGTNSYAFGINEKRQITGARDLGDMFSTAFVLRGSEFVDVGNLGGTGPADGSISYAINSKGHVTGQSADPNGGFPGFFWSEKTGIVNIGSLGGDFVGGLGINDSDMVVGRSSTATGLTRAFVWTMEQGMRDLGSLKTDGSSIAESINNRGQIVGRSDTPDGQRRAVVWTPRQGHW